MIDSVTVAFICFMYHACIIMHCNSWVLYHAGFHPGDTQIITGRYVPHRFSKVGSTEPVDILA